MESHAPHSSRDLEPRSTCGVVALCCLCKYSQRRRSLTGWVLRQSAVRTCLSGFWTGKVVPAVMKTRVPSAMCSFLHGSHGNKTIACSGFCGTGSSAGVGMTLVVALVTSQLCCEYIHGGCDSQSIQKHILRGPPPKSGSGSS